MTTEDGRYAIVYNGEVYNFLEVRAELESIGERFVSETDTEVVLKAYVRWGKDSVRRFRGMFAFGVWDARDETLFLVRDRLGIKPLYYTNSTQGFAFASEVRTLLATGFAPRRLSYAGLAGYLAFGSVSESANIIEGVHAVPPGCTLELRKGKASITAYWSLPMGGRAERNVREEAVLEELRPLLREAVGLRLVSDVPVGVFLSGGIDSSAITALASRALGKPLHTFTVTFDEAAYSEARYAAAVAERFGCIHQQVYLPADQVAGEMGNVIRALDQPSADGVNTYFVSSAAREAGLSVALSGLGGDELFGGYSSFRTFRTLRRMASALRLLPTFINERRLFAEAFNGTKTRTRKAIALAEAAGRGGVRDSYGVLRAMFTLEQRRALLNNVTDSSLLNDFGTIEPDALAAAITSGRGVDSVNAYSALELSNYMRHTLLRDADVMSMAHSLEVRVPLLDHKLVEYVMNLPGKLKLRRGTNKPLLTAAVPELGRQVTARRKMGFTFPFATWFRKPLRAWMEDLLLGDAAKRLSFLDAGNTEKLWKSFLKGEEYVSYSRVWCIAALVGWCRENGVES